MSYFFLSYAKADTDSAELIYKMLEQEGFRVWMDKNSGDWAEKHWPLVVENIRNAEAFILLVSDAAKKSKTVQRELEFAEKRQMQVFPILIAGEGWSGLNQRLWHLGIGLNLELPDALFLELKNFAKGEQKPLPAQLPPTVISQEEREARRKSTRAALIALIALVAIIASILSRQNTQSSSENRALALTNEAGRYLMITATALSRETSRVEFSTNQTATQVARNIAVQTQQERDNPGRSATGTARSAERLAATMTAVEVDLNATSAQLVEMNSTAIAGNGTLPCTARTRQENGISDFNVYGQPSLDSAFTRVQRDAGQTWFLFVTEWIVNEDGDWYRVSRNGRMNIGYIRAEDLELDETCPR